MPPAHPTPTELFEQHRHRAIGTAKAYARFSRRSDEADDLVQEALLGLWQAARAYDPTKLPTPGHRRTSFSTFAHWFVIGAIDRHLRSHAWCCRIPRQHLVCTICGKVNALPRSSPRERKRPVWCCACKRHTPHERRDVSGLERWSYAPITLPDFTGAWDADSKPPRDMLEMQRATTADDPGFADADLREAIERAMKSANGSLTQADRKVIRQLLDGEDVRPDPESIERIRAVLLMAAIRPGQQDSVSRDMRCHQCAG